MTVAENREAAQHTGGKWTAGRMGGSPDWAIESTDGCDEGCSQLIAVVKSADDQTTEADARLIAAAPELLEALEKMSHEWDHAHTDEELEGAVEVIRAAIARAKGEGGAA